MGGAIPAQGRVLAVDWGERRIGLALSDPTQTIGQPLAVLTRRLGRRFPMIELRRHIEQSEAVGVVVGLPLTPGGAEGDAAAAARETGAHIASATGLPVEFIDERMSTARVIAGAREAGSAHPDRTTIDAITASVLLTQWLERRRASR